MSAIASTIDPTLAGDTTADGRAVRKSELAEQFTAAQTDFDDASAVVVRHLQNTVTQAELNAGKTILAGVTGRTIKVVGFMFRFTGTFATGTSMELEDTNVTPVVVASVATANMTGKKDPADANVTLTTFGAALTAGAGLAVTATGAAFTGGTNIVVDVLYVLT